MSKPKKKFKFVFKDDIVISADTMVEMADKYFKKKDFYDQYSYYDLIYNYKSKKYER